MPCKYIKSPYVFFKLRTMVMHIDFSENSLYILSSSISKELIIWNCISGIKQDSPNLFKDEIW